MEISDTEAQNQVKDSGSAPKASVFLTVKLIYVKFSLLWGPCTCIMYRLFTTKSSESSFMMSVLSFQEAKMSILFFKAPMTIKLLDFYCKERITAPESSDHTFWAAQREFHNSKLIRQ